MRKGRRFSYLFVTFAFIIIYCSLPLSLSLSLSTYIYMISYAYIIIYAWARSAEEIEGKLHALLIFKEIIAFKKVCNWKKKMHLN